MPSNALEKLKDAIAQNRAAVEEVPAPPQTTPTARKPAKATRPEKVSTRGTRFHIYLQDEETRILRDFAAYLAGQGERPNDSLVLRAALHAVTPNAAFVRAFREARQLDGRLKGRK